MSRSMSLLSALLLLPLVHSCGVFGSTPCAQVCDYSSDCLLDQLEEGGLECDWEDDEKTARRNCLEACKEEYSKLSGDERSEVKACIVCVQDELDGDCDLKDYNDAVYDDCEDECEENDVEDFFEDFWDELDVSDDLDCETGGYNYTGPGTGYY